jgi:hypothetical protein
MLGEEIGQARQHVVAPEPPRHRQGQAFLRILVDHRQDAERPTVMGLVLHEVIAPDMARPAWPETDARSVVQPEPPAFGLFLGDFQPLTLPDPFDPRHADLPALHGQQTPDPTIAISIVLGGQRDDRPGEHVLVWPASRDLALGRSVLAKNSAGPALGDIEHRGHMIDTGTATRGA